MYDKINSHERDISDGRYYSCCCYSLRRRRIGIIRISGEKFPDILKSVFLLLASGSEF